MHPTCASCGADVLDDTCARCGRPLVLPTDYLSMVEELTRDIVEAAVRESTFNVFSFDEGSTPLQNAITRAAMHLKYWEYTNDGGLTQADAYGLHAASKLQRRLLAALDRVSAEVSRKDWGYETPSPRKLICEGHAIARAAILDVPARGSDYLDRVLTALESARERQDACGISNDSWEDIDGYIVSGINDALREAEKLRNAE